MGIQVNSADNRSTFVTVVAWIFISLSGFATIISILQNIMIQTMFSGPEMEKALQAPTAAGAPPLAAFMTSHFQLFFFAFLIVSALMLASSIGLLKRKNWARLLFIGLMILGIVWQLGGLVLQFTMFSFMQDSFTNAPGAPNIKPFIIGVAVVSVMFALGMSGLFGWIVKRLLSPTVTAEFK
jgi:hypothetical protein